MARRILSPAKQFIESSFLFSQKTMGFLEAALDLLGPTRLIAGRVTIPLPPAVTTTCAFTLCL